MPPAERIDCIALTRRDAFFPAPRPGNAESQENLFFYETGRAKAPADAPARLGGPVPTTLSRAALSRAATGIALCRFRTSATLTAGDGEILKKNQ
jgi:hypothetical protein